MKTIHKYQLLVVDTQLIHIHKNADVLAVQTQYDAIALWAKVDTDEEKEFRRISIYGTGRPCDVDESRMLHIGTVQHQGLVWHVFIGPQ